MVTENVDIVFRERGVRIIKRRLDDLGIAANNATRAIFLLQRAFFVIGGAGLLSGLTAQLDALTAYENRIRLTAKSAENVEQVQDRLFAAANRSRTSFSALAEIYSRTALSVRDLGISQSETLRFTESLAKASIIGGASAREANAALIQLGQGLASNRLSGDELRSVLEQLPFVADVIARSIGVTRGELRKLGMEGKISADIVLEAFRNAEKEIDTLFAQTIPTISQAFAIAGNNFNQFLDSFDDATGFSAAVASAIIAISENLDKLATSAGIAAIGALGFAFDLLLKRVVAAGGGFLSYLAAVQKGNVVLLGSVQAQQQKAAFTLASAQADNAATAAAVNKTQAQLANTQSLIANARAQVTNTEFVRVGNQARLFATGRFANLTAATNAHSAAVQRLNILESLQASQQTRLSAQQGALAASTTALAAATNAQAAAAARAATFTGRLALAYPALTAVVLRATAALRAFGAILLANPLTVLFVAASAAAVALNRLKDTTQAVNAVTDSTSAVIRDIGRAFEEASKSGKELKEVYDGISEAQLALQVTTAQDALRDSIKSLVDQLQGFNNIATGLRTTVTLDTVFLRAKTELDKLFVGVKEGTTDLRTFKDQVATLAAEVDNPRFTKFANQIIATTDNIIDADSQVKLLQAALAQLAGTATEAQTALLRTAAGLDSVSNSANAATTAINFFIDQIPALKEAAKVNATLREASTNLEAGQARLKQELAAGNLTVQEYAGRVANLNKLYNVAVNEIDGTADAQRDFNKELERNNLDAELAGLDSLGRALRQNEINYNNLRDAAIKAGASEADLAQLAANRAALDEAARKNAAKKGGGGPASTDPTFLSEIDNIEGEIDLLRRYATEVGFVNDLIRIERDLKRSLTDSERELAVARLEVLQVAREEAAILQDILGPQKEFEITQTALNNLFEQGAISLGQYLDKLRDIKEATDAASGSLAGGFTTSISQAIINAGEFGTAVGDIVVGSIDRAADAIVEFARTGKINLKSLFSDLFAQLLKLAAQQLLLRFVGSLLGIPGGGFGGGPVGGFGSLFSSSGGSIVTAASGGSIRPTGPGSTDTRMIPLMTRPDERIDILTPQQQLQQREIMRGANGGAGGGGAVVNVAVVVTEDDIASAFAGQTGDLVIVKGIERNSDSVRKVLGG